MKVWKANYNAKHPKRVMLASAKDRARRKGLPFALTEHDFEIPATCPVLGIALHHASKQHDGSPTLDRLNPTRGYVPDNVRVISQRADRIKNDATLAELKAVVRYMEKA